MAILIAAVSLPFTRRSLMLTRLRHLELRQLTDDVFHQYPSRSSQ